MYVSLYIEINILSIVLLFILAVRSFQVGLDASYKKKAFIFAIVSAIVANLSDIVACLAGERIIPSTVAMYAAAFCYFTALSLTTLAWIVFSDVVHHDSTVNYKFSIKILYVLPLIVLITAEVLNIFFGFFFYFDESGIYHRGTFFYFQHLISYLYVLCASALNIARYIKKEYAAKRRDYLALLIFSLPPLIAMALQLIFTKLPIISFYPPISFLLTYMHSLRLQIALDPLTAINNRRSLILAIEHKTKNLHKQKSLCFFFVDIDDFKKLNDTYGHYDGDRVLQLVADALRYVSLETGGTCARYGGDEFAMILEINGPKDIEEVSSKINNEIQSRVAFEKFSFPINVSIGNTIYDEYRDTVETLISRADKHMYAIKNEKRKLINPDSENNSDNALPPPRKKKKKVSL